MSSWLLRGVVMSIVHIVARILLGVVVISAPLSSPLGRWLAILAVVLVAIVWGGLDGIKDARAHDDPDEYTDLTVRWLKAAVFAAFVSCLVCWILGTFWLNGIGQASFWIDMTAGLSFITLLIYVPAFFGATLGRFFVRRDQRKAEQKLEDAKTTELATA
ncbi:MAG: B-4DMT family transporter [Gordonia sp. (in: high G+C Gram-positive bacteria)]|uniref:B-4DMT family transporter n=1 Tax=Gordonia sp. (in: high G+C Gram-positive bacteria) TaxID=84139 RepID=UPI003C70D470